ncbi:hypothetical protein [Aeromicrobium endophyticum]|uniref:Uncharacterized protein n=1 Tax=Aeromicrobium endophyticum TaxID=2292704 RepID=A0A371PCH6_9ACTN|nr:hypothetical protein [Aeromicrobium endophyticum]REK73639.1 hypothetical protein DX116_08925 [Aeromicrobium endophyticum]
MATDGFASWIDNAGLYKAADLRRADSVLMMPGGPTTSPFAVKGGRRVNGAGLQVSVGGSPESWTCTPGAGVVSDPAYLAQGGWRYEIPNATTGLIGARPAAGQSRIDLIVARIYDTTAIGSGAAEVKIERIPGAAGQDPQAPTPPAGSITDVVARMLVKDTGAVVVTPSTERTVAAGGILPVPTTAAMDKLKADGITYRGMVVDNAQTDSLHRYDGTRWKRLVDPSALLSVPAKRWGVDFDPTKHIPKRLAWTLVSATTPGGITAIVNDLKPFFVGVGAVQVTGSADDALRYVKSVLSGDQLLAYCYGANNGGVISQTVTMDVTIDGWV